MRSLLIKLCLINLFAIFWVDAIAQSYSSKIDSLHRVLQTQKADTNKVNTLNELASIKPLGDSDVRLQTVNEALSLADKLVYKKGIADAHAIKGKIFYANGNYDKSATEQLIALQIRKEINDKAGMLSSSLRLGYTYSLQNNLPATFKYFFLSLKAAEEIKDTVNISKLLIEIAKAYQFQNDSSSARKYFKLAVQYANKLVATEKLIDIYADLATASFNIGEYQKALEFAITSQKNYIEKGDSLQAYFQYVTISNVYIAKADSALKTGNPQLGKRLYLNAITYYHYFERYCQSSNDKANLSAIYSNIADAFFKIKYFDSARSYYEKSLKYSIETDILVNLEGDYQGLYSLDSIQNNYKEAFKNYKLYTFYRDSLTNKNDLAKVEFTRLQYEFDKKEAIAKAEQQKKDADAKRLKNQQYFTIAALGIVVLAALIIALIQFRNNKQKQKANRLITHQKEKVETTLTELKSTQSQLIQSEKMASLGELTAGIAHEIQNPLNFVNNFSEVNKEMIDEATEEIDKGNIKQVKNLLNNIKDNSEKINHHGKRADAIVKGMLQHSRKSEGVKEPTDINALCDEYLRLSYHGLRAKDKSFNADFKTYFDNTIGKINIVPQDIGRVLLNLYNNAFYAVNEKSKMQNENYKPLVTVSTKSSLSFGEGRGEVLIIVSDNGNGISQKVLDKIFQPFFTTKPTGQGTGLGLSLSYDIIKAHGGEIKVETIQGQGTTFFIQLPVV